MSLACHYCGRLVSEPWEFQRDHFPRPKSKGGARMVIACNECHHLKDRANFMNLYRDFQSALDAHNGLPTLAGFWYSWDDFLGCHDDGTALVAAKVAERNWPAWPVELRRLAGRMLREMDW